MSLNRAVVSVASILFCVTAAVAEEPETTAKLGPKLHACSQSMIVGTWQAVFWPASTRGFACPISIADNGTLTPGTCTLPDSNFTLTQVPSGSMTIDRACHVVGSIAYTFCDPPYSGSSCQTYQQSVSLWRSSDGSRLSGFQHSSCLNCIGGPLYFVYPFELIAGQ